MLSQCLHQRSVCRMSYRALQTPRVAPLRILSTFPAPQVVWRHRRTACINLLECPDAGTLIAKKDAERWPRTVRVVDAAEAQGAPRPRHRDRETQARQTSSWTLPTTSRSRAEIFCGRRKHFSGWPRSSLPAAAVVVGRPRAVPSRARAKVAGRLPAHRRTERVHALLPARAAPPAVKAATRSLALAPRAHAAQALNAAPQASLLAPSRKAEDRRIVNADQPASAAAAAKTVRPDRPAREGAASVAAHHGASPGHRAHQTGPRQRSAGSKG